MDLSKHPCFNDAVRHQFGRIHLPVAPTCNIQCNFCDRRFDCLNESRPGVTSVVLTPERALGYLQQSLQSDPRITVVGIAGPGDPFADPEPTLRTLRLVRHAYPEMLLCVASNGLNVPPHVEQLAELAVSHVTLTVNAVDPEIGAKIYAWVRDDRRPFRGRVAAGILLERQLQAIAALKARGILVKINSILIPGV
ncbi:MAG: radical SAM protein, partial [Planctomycetes bacterium]|nr:radical SAM protein [Planctomycetota bacterium]